MPILKKEIDIFPGNLLQCAELLADETRTWFCVYTISRREKDLVRKLAGSGIACYLPIVPKRYRSPAGRLRTSYVPLFPNYVFLYANSRERESCLKTNCVSGIQPIPDQDRIVLDLQAIQIAIAEGVPLTTESRIDAGQRVRVRSGPFQGYEGLVLRREGKTRLLLSINFLEQGVSMEMDEAVLDAV